MCVCVCLCVCSPMCLCVFAIKKKTSGRDKTSAEDDRETEETLKAIKRHDGQRRTSGTKVKKIRGRGKTATRKQKKMTATEIFLTLSAADQEEAIREKRAVGEFMREGKENDELAFELYYGMPKKVWHGLLISLVSSVAGGMGLATASRWTSSTTCPSPKPCEPLQDQQFKSCGDPLSKLVFLSTTKNMSGFLERENYMELMTEHKWLGSVDAAGASHESMFADISNDNNRLFYSEFAYHLNCDSNFAQQIIDEFDNARPE